MQTGGEQSRLKFREYRRLQSALASQLVHQRSEQLDPLGVSFDFHAAYPNRILVVADDDDRVIEVDLTEDRVPNAQLVRSPPGPYFEEVGKRSVTGQCTQSASDRSPWIQRIETSWGEGLTYLDPSSQPGHCWRGVLQGHFSLVSQVSDTEDETGSSDSPVLGIEIDIDGSPHGLGHHGDDDGSPARTSRHHPGECGQPPLHGSEIERVQLPLDLDVCWVRPPLGHRGRLLGRVGAFSGSHGGVRPHPLFSEGLAVASDLMARTAAPKPRRARSDRDVVRAAGGIVLREVAGDRREVVVVHSPGRGDWSLPKGKLDADESSEECALREVEEETGLRCLLRRFAGSTEYRDRRDRPKIVSYWIMDVLDGEFTPSDEVDEMAWLELSVARRSLTYERDRDLIATLDVASLAQSG